LIERLFEQPVARFTVTGGIKVDVKGLRQSVALVIEDDSSIRNLVSIVLERDGFRTLAASNASEARKLWRNRAESIDVVVTDVDLGDGDGVELAGSIRQERTDMPVLVISGTASGARARANECAFLAKPFSPGKMVAEVRRLLHSEGLTPGTATGTKR
jgi:DNA-binding NtrC family response regulator